MKNLDSIVLNSISNKKADLRRTRTLKATLRITSFEFKSNLSLVSFITPRSLVLEIIGIKISSKISRESTVCLVECAPFEKKIAFVLDKLSEILIVSFNSN